MQFLQLVIKDSVKRMASILSVSEKCSDEKSI